MFDLILFSKRSPDGAHHKQMQEFRSVEDQKFMFKNFLRMDESAFDELLVLVAPIIAKSNTNMRAAIPSCERLTITLRFLATGESYASLAVLFRVAHNTISVIVPEVCDAIYQVLKGRYLKVCERVYCDMCAKSVYFNWFYFTSF